MQNDKKQYSAIVIGSGFAGLSAACELAKEGYQVTLLEKNESPGGRASVFKHEGFTFDMGPSWYWMPDVFEHFFSRFGKRVDDYYELKRLDPSYRVFFGENDSLDIPASMPALEQLFEQLEQGSSKRLQKFMAASKEKYEAGINDLVYRPSRSVWEFADWKLISGLLRLQLLSSLRKEVYSLFKNDRIRKILEFPVYFLGALPQNTPALYSLMNYADLQLGTWYPKGGMFKIVEAMVHLAESLGVDIKYNTEVLQLVTTGGSIQEVVTSGNSYKADVIISAADYHHTEQVLLKPNDRKYSPDYWEKRTMAPSSLIFYLGIDKKLNHLLHHNLFFDRSFETFAEEIYVQPRWPSQPLFYVCAPSVTDVTVAPQGKENLFILVPLAPGLDDNENLRQQTFHHVMERLERLTQQNIRQHICYNRSFCVEDFKSRYHSFKGNAYGLANTLSQTAIFKPSIKNKKVRNLYYTGQLTVPGPGVPPSIISGIVVAREVLKEKGQCY